MSDHSTCDDTNHLTLFRRGDVNTHGNCGLTNANTSTADVIQQQEWTLDALGNWSTNGITINNTPEVQTRTHNKANEITDITTNDTIYPTYDDNGNLTNDGTFIYSYDADNRLTRVQNQGFDTISESHYDALGRRVRKVVTNTDDYDGDYRYLWNQDWQLMSVYIFADSELKPRQRLVHAGSPAAWYPQLGVGGGRAYIDDHICIYVPGGMGGGRKYFHTDAQYNTQMVTDASSNIAASYVLSAYGLVETITQPGMGGLGSYATNNAMIHQGLIYDAETGSYYNRNRILKPDLARFLQRDPVPSRGQHSSYEYLDDSPITRVDAKGLQPSALQLTPGTPSTCRVTPRFDREAVVRENCDRRIQELISINPAIQHIIDMITSRGCRVPSFFCDVCNDPCQGVTGASDPVNNIIFICQDRYNAPDVLEHELWHTFQVCSMFTPGEGGETPGIPFPPPNTPRNPCVRSMAIEFNASFMTECNTGNRVADCKCAKAKAKLHAPLSCQDMAGPDIDGIIDAIGDQYGCL